MLAIAAGALEVIGGLMIALNFGARFFAILLILFVAVATFYFHDFWNQTGAVASATMVHALKNLSIIGALFMIVGYAVVADAGSGLWRRLEPSFPHNRRLPVVCAWKCDRFSDPPPWRDADAVSASRISARPGFEAVRGSESPAAIAGGTPGKHGCRRPAA